MTVLLRALVWIVGELFKPFLAKELRFRGGTALNKLHFPKPLRYSEDIHLVRTTEGPIGPILDRVREILNPWMGKPSFDQSPVAPKLRYSIDPENKTSLASIRLKVEINTREREANDPVQLRPLKVENPWFSGAVEIPTFSNEELLATKLRALLQRNKGRDLIDLSNSLETFDALDALDTKKVVELFGKYVAAAGISISRAQSEQRMFEKLDNPDFMADVRPLLAADAREAFDDEAATAAFTAVFDEIIRLISGAAWERTGEMIERFKLTGL